jgi:hypothetical protein
MNGYNTSFKLIIKNIYKYENRFDKNEYHRNFAQHP